MRLFAMTFVPLALAFLHGMALGQAAPRAGGYRIAGRVIDEITGEPLNRVTVNVVTDQYNQMLASMVTDAQGHFAFDHVPAGKYPLSAAKRGYRTAFYDEHDDFNSAIVTGPDQDTAHLIFRLTPGAILHGLVTGDGGDPVENAQVMLFRRDASAASGARMQQAGNAETDDIGAYEFNGLQAGDYLIAVKGEPWYAQHDNRVSPGSQEQSPLDVAFPITYFDSTTDEGSATSIALAAGSSEEADINLHAVPALHFSLPVLSRSADERTHLSVQQRVFGNVVNAERMEISDPKSPTLDIGGIAPGNYDVEFGDPPRRMTVHASSNIDLEAGAGIPTLSISGRLVMASGGPVPDDVTLSLTSVDDSQAELQAFAHQGGFEFKDVSAGAWRLSAGTAKEPIAVLATSEGGGFIAGDKLTVRDHPLNLTVAVGRAQTSIHGFARKDGKGAPGVMVVLVPKEPAAYPALVRRDQSDSDGSFALRDVPAGQYIVIAIEDGWKLDWQKREAIAPYLRTGVTVTVSDQDGPVVSLAQPVATVPR